MPRPITLEDIQDQENHPISVADRIRRWELANQLHQFHRPQAPGPLPPCLEIITHRPGEAGKIIAAHRLLSIYERGVPVISDASLLFGDRLLPQELGDWDAQFRPGQAGCLGDSWYNFIIPQVPDGKGAGTRDFDPSSAAWEQRQDEVKKELERLERVVNQGCHLVLVLTRSPFLPPWQVMVDAPMVLVATAGLPLTGLSRAQYVTTNLEVEELTGGSAALDPPTPHVYDRLTPEMLQDAVTLTSVFDHRQETGKL